MAMHLEYILKIITDRNPAWNGVVLSDEQFKGIAKPVGQIPNIIFHGDVGIFTYKISIPNSIPTYLYFCSVDFTDEEFGIILYYDSAKAKATHASKK
jgi:hypothetical protein